MVERSNNDTSKITTSSIDIGRISAPVLTLLSMAGMIVWGTTSILNEKQKMREEFQIKITQLAKEKDEKHEVLNGELRQLKDIIFRQNEVIVSIRERQHFLLDNMWSKKDHLLWCKEAERINKDINKTDNFTCPNYEQLKELGLLGSYERYGINNGLSKDNEIMNELKKKMEIERDDNYNIWNKTVPRHDPNTPHYQQ